MSRIGRMPIELPKGATVAVDNGEIRVEGPKGKLTHAALDGIEVEIEGSTVTFSRQGDSGPERARHGLLRSLVANAVQGVTEGFRKELEIIGVGYRGQIEGREAHFALGYSHPVIYPIPEGIEMEIDKQNKISISGYDKQAVGQVAAEIRSLRPPDPYKGKGIRHLGETVRLKVGKSGATA